MIPTPKGATASGQITPASSWLASIRAPTRRDTPTPYEPIWTATSPLSGPETTAFIGLEYLSPKKNTCPTSIPRVLMRLSAGVSASKRAASCTSSVAA